MKLVFAGLVLMTQVALADANGYYQFKKPVIREVASGIADSSVFVGNFNECGSAAAPNAKTFELSPSEGLDEANVIVDKIINLGKKVWSVVELGRPVANVKVDTANALPKGVKCWLHLTNWMPTFSKSYEVVYENLWGVEVVKFGFRVLYTAGGSFQGTGRYITNATILPSVVTVSWGYTFNANGEVPTVFNAGSAQAPLAGMQMNMKWKVETVLKTDERIESFYIDGNGTLKHLE